MRAEKFREFLHLLPNGFSYPTTSTMAFFRSAYPVAYVPVAVARAVGLGSHIRPLRDGLRFLLIIFKIATLYSPLKLFAPVAVAFFLTALGYYGWTFVTAHRLDQHEHAAVQCLGHHFPDRLGLGTDHVTDLPQA